MKYQKTTLPNKLKVITVPMPSMQSATVQVWVKAGSRLETEKIRGITHFLEHMVFKGTKNFKTAKDLSFAMDSLGAEYNAMTSKEWTSYFIKVRAGIIEKAFEILSDLVLYPRLDSVEIDKEKGVIVEEMRMYKDTPKQKIGDYFENLIYKGSKLEGDIIGTEKTVKGVKRKDFVSYMKRHYYPENMLITVSGGVTTEKVVNLTKKYFSDLKPRSKVDKKPKELFNQRKPQVLLKGKDAKQTHIIIGYRGEELGNKRRYEEGLLAAVLGVGMSSRLFTVVREEKGLAYAIRSISDKYSDNGYVATYAGLDTKRIDEAIKIIIDQHYGLADERFKLEEDELVKAKEFLKGNLALSLENTRAVNEFYATEEMFLGKARTPEDVYKSIDKVTCKDVVGVAKDYFKPERLNLAIIGPYKNKKRFEKLLS
ncbi:M16 family metallopeptidase [Patescibacteria group bacterium]